MRYFFKSFWVLGLLWVTVANAAGATKEIKMKTDKQEDGKIHWVTADGSPTVEVTAGEKVKFVVMHSAPGGFDFHGFQIDGLKDVKGKKIEAQVNRKTPVIIEAVIPPTKSPDKDDEYTIGCQFHPAHVGAKLIVKPSGKK